MRVMHVITRMIIGGAQENTLYNCLDLRDLYGDEVLLVTGPADGPEGDLLDQGRAGDLAIQIVPELRRAIHPLRDARALSVLRRLMRSYRPDVVHTHSAKGGFLGRRAAWTERIAAIVHTVHGAPFHPYQSPPARELFRLCERKAARWCDHLISVADAMTDLLVSGGVAPRDKFTTVYSGMDVEPLLAADQLHRATVRQRLGFQDDQIVIGKIARLFHLKGHEDLITAAVEVVKTNPQVRFLLVGDGILRQPLQRRIRELGLCEHFVFTGLVPPVEIPSLIAAMDALVHTSYREGLARALPQALIVGRPVISYDVDGAREVVLNDQTGFLVPPGDTRMLADRLTALAASEDARQSMGAAGRQRFTDLFRHQSMTARIRKIYEQLLAHSDR
jgi:glycosyltransferase involved in cell wall biosynthesis